MVRMRGPNAVALLAVALGLALPTGAFAHDPGGYNSNGNGNWTLEAYAQLSSPTYNQQYSFGSQINFTAGSGHKLRVTNELATAQNITYHFLFNLNGGAAGAMGGLAASSSPQAGITYAAPAHGQITVTSNLSHTWASTLPGDYEAETATDVSSGAYHAVTDHLHPFKQLGRP